MRSEEAIAFITKAFSKNGIPDKSKGILPDYISLRGEVKPIEKGVLGIPWTKITGEALLGTTGHVYMMSPEYLAYVIPAYMVFCLRDPAKADLLPLSVISAMGLQYMKKPKPSFLDLLDERKLAAVFYFFSALCTIADDEKYVLVRERLVSKFPTLRKLSE